MDKSIRESDIQNWMVSIIENETFYNFISNIEELEKIDSAGINTTIPHFNVNQLCRQKYAKSGLHTLGHLKALNIISSDKNISAEAGQVMRPDIVAFNYETNSIVVFELKKSNQTERQAMTELLAYEQEIQNHFPFFSGLDIVFVLVSTEWNTLLDHAVSSAISWSNKKFLALKLNPNEQEWKLQVHIPDAWSSIPVSSLSGQSISTVTLCLYPKINQDGSEEVLENNKQLFIGLNALNKIMKEGERTHSHGFAFLWKDSYPNSLTKYNFTIASINPYSFMEHILIPEENSKNKTHTALSNYFFDNIQEFVFCTPDSTFRVSDTAHSFLKKFLNPTYETIIDWENNFVVLPHRAEPIAIEFWGILSEYANDFLSSPIIQEHYFPFANDGRIDERTPEVGLFILNYVTGRGLLKEGILTISECCKIGILLGGYLIAIKNYKASLAPFPWHNLLWWIQNDLMQFISELCIIINQMAIKNKPPEFNLSLEKENLDSKEKSATNFIEWFSKEVITENYSFHRELFHIGMSYSYLFYDVFKSIPMPDQYQELNTNCRDILKEIIIQATLSSLELSEGEQKLEDLSINILFKNEGVIPGENIETHLKRTYDQTYDCSENLSLILRFLDTVFQPVYQDIPDPSYIDTDWEYLKSEVKKLRQKGEKYPVVALSPNGTILIKIMETYMGDIKNPDEEVWFLNGYSGFAVLIKTTWNALISGEAFKKQGK